MDTKLLRGMSVILIVLVLVTSFAPLHADTVTLKSGKVYEGVETQPQPGDKVKIIKEDGSSLVVPNSMIAKIEKKLSVRQEMEQHRKALPPKDAAARVKLAAWCDERGFQKEARKLYEEAVAIDPTCAEAREALGHIQYKTRWYADEATLVAKEAELAAKDLAGLRELVEHCKQNKQEGLLAPVFKRVLDLAPDDEAAHRGLGHVLERGMWAETKDPKARLKALLENKAAATVDAYLAIGLETKQQGRWYTMRAAAGLCLKDFPESASRWNEIFDGTIFWVCGDEVRRFSDFRAIGTSAESKMQYHDDGSSTEVALRSDGTRMREQDFYSNHRPSEARYFAKDGKTLAFTAYTHYESDGSDTTVYEFHGGRCTGFYYDSETEFGDVCWVGSPYTVDKAKILFKTRTKRTKEVCVEVTTVRPDGTVVEFTRQGWKETAISEAKLIGSDGMTEVEADTR